MVKVVPSPGRLDRWIQPRWSSTVVRTTAIPSPVPLVPMVFLVKKGSKMRGWSDGAIPTPLSWIDSTQ